MSAGLAVALASGLPGACGGEPAPEVDGTAGAQHAAPPAPLDGEPLDGEPRTPATTLWFEDATQSSGLGRFIQVNGSPEKPWLLEGVGGGVALFDADGDGRLDVYLANGGRLEPSPEASADPPPRDALFRNVGAFAFEDATEAFGLGSERWTMGAYPADLDADGRADLYLTAWGRNTLYVRAADARFVDATETAGVGDERWSTGAAYLDFDRDGDLDLYVANYAHFDRAHPPTERQSFRGVEVHFGPRGMPGERDTFYRNRGDGTFTDATEEAGVGSTAFGFQAVAFDYDDDGWIDVFVGDDSTPNRLWRNDGGERFVDRAYEAGAALSKSGMEQAAMGVAVGDVDGDGLFDLFVTNFSEDYHTLYRGTAGGLFRDMSLTAGLVGPTLASLGWGCGIVDLDNDGTPELLAANGHIYPQVDRFEFATRYRQKNQLFARHDARRFDEVTLGAGPGWAVEAASRGFAWGDLDADGDLDLVFGNLDGPPTVLRNESRAVGRFARIMLEGAGRNRDAIGAVVRVTAGGRTSIFAAGSSSSFLSTSERAIHVGLGAAEVIDRVEVRWPAGATQAFAGLPVGRTVRLVEGRPDFLVEE